MKRTVKNSAETSQSKKAKDSSAILEGVKFRVTFLASQNFRGKYYKVGEFIDLPEADAKAYAARTTLLIERLG